MNWTKFKDPVSHMCLAGTVVACWSLTQEVAGSSPFTVMKNILLLNSVKTFRENCNDCTKRSLTQQPPSHINMSLRGAMPSQV